MQLGRDHLQVLNQIVQALPLEERLNYLVGLGKIWEEIESSQFFFVDKRDYNIYTVVKIGDQDWLGENLRYKGGKYYENPDNPTIMYGCLYDWATVMNIDERYNKEQWNGPTQGHQGIAPEGWCIPSDEDWKVLERSLGMSKSNVNSVGYRGDIGGKLKSTDGWYNGGNGSNSSGFNVLPAGNSWSGGFFYLNKTADFWFSKSSPSSYAWLRRLSYLNGEINSQSEYKAVKCSLRCMLYK